MHFIMEKQLLLSFLNAELNNESEFINTAFLL